MSILFYEIKYTQHQRATPHDESKPNFIFLRKFELLLFTDCQQLIPQLISNSHISQIPEGDYRFISITDYLQEHVKKVSYSGNSYAINDICNVYI